MNLLGSTYWGETHHNRKELFMYSHLAKGFTLGERLTRRLFRKIIGFPGLLIDVFFIAPIFRKQSGKYSDFWVHNQAHYPDGSEVSGFAQVILGYVGDLTGAVVGGFIGSLLGFAFYIPDGILRLVALGHDYVQDQLDKLANVMAEKQHVFSDLTIKLPATYLAKAWNISAVTLGAVLAAIPYLFAKSLEFFIPPFGSRLSEGICKAGAFFGGVIGSLTAIVFFPLKHVCNRLVDLFRDFREAVRTITAIVYAQTNVSIYDSKDCIPPPAAVHSEKFVNKVNSFKDKPLSDIIFSNSTTEIIKNIPVNAGNEVIPPSPSAPLDIERVPKVSTLSAAPSNFVVINSKP